MSSYVAKRRIFRGTLFSGCPPFFLSIAMRDDHYTASRTLLLMAIFGGSISHRAKNSPGHHGLHDEGQQKKNRIVGGTPAGPFLTRHLAHLIVDYKDGQYSGLCTATVLAPRRLLMFPVQLYLVILCVRRRIKCIAARVKRCQNTSLGKELLSPFQLQARRSRSSP